MSQVEVIKSLSRIFFNHVFLVQIQKRRNAIEMIRLQSLSIQTNPMHCIHPLYRCPENGIAHSQSWSKCSLSTPNNRFRLQWAVAVELHVSFSERKIHSVHALVCVHYYRIEPDVHQFGSNEFCVDSVCSSFRRFVPRNLRFNSFAAQRYGELTETTILSVSRFPYLSLCMHEQWSECCTKRTSWLNVEEKNDPNS